MKNLRIYRVNKIIFLFLILGVTLVFTNTSYSQRNREKVRQANPDDYFSDEPGSVKKQRNAVEALKGNRKSRSNAPKEMGGLLGVNSKNKECSGTLKVNIAASHSVVYVGQTYTFVALSSGGCKGSYKYQWSGTNLGTGSGKRTGLLNRNTMTASFKNTGISTISVAVVDSKNNRSSDRIAVKVLPKR